MAETTRAAGAARVVSGVRSQIAKPRERCAPVEHVDISGNFFRATALGARLPSQRAGMRLATRVVAWPEDNMTMVVRIFDTLTDAQRAVSDLMESGYARNAISVLVRDALAPARAGLRRPAPARPACPCDEHHRGRSARHVLHRDSEAVSARCGDLMPQARGPRLSAAQFFADAICRGAILVAVHCDDGEVRDAREILDVHHATAAPSQQSWLPH